MRRFSSLPTAGLGVLALLLSVARTSHAQTITTFDAPNAVGTFPQAVSAFGTIVGFYQDSSNASHGFTRFAQGTITTFDVPGSGTFPLAVNRRGQITGSVFSERLGVPVSRGFLREADGRVTEFDASADALVTRPEAINAQGWVAGTYLESGAQHGFLRLGSGAVTSYDVPGLIGAINEVGPRGELVGWYLEPHGLQHGFAREPDGTITSFDAPDVNTSTAGIGCPRCGGTRTTAANAAGVVGYFGGAGGSIRGFVRRANGTFQVLDVPAAASTLPSAINLKGDVAGQYLAGGLHNFLLPRNGSFQSFDLVGAFSTNVIGVDLRGDVVGYFADANGSHGFVRSVREVCEHHQPSSEFDDDER
jgi:hypothetical protein